MYQRFQKRKTPKKMFGTITNKQPIGCSQKKLSEALSKSMKASIVWRVPL